MRCARIDQQAASLVPVPPQLVLERSNLKGRQLRIEDTSELAGKRVLLMLGSEDSDHPIAADKPIVDRLNAQGPRAHFLYLGERGIEGNGHMMMLESNSDQLADFLIEWIEKA